MAEPLLHGRQADGGGGSGAAAAPPAAVATIELANGKLLSISAASVNWVDRRGRERCMEFANIIGARQLGGLGTILEVGQLVELTPRWYQARTALATVKRELRTQQFQCVSRAEVDRGVGTVRLLALGSSSRARRVRVILNPHSGRRIARELFWTRMAPLLDYAGIRFDTTATDHPGHAVELGKEYNPDTYEGALFVGGDGTVQEFVSGLLSRPDWRTLVRRTPICTVASGTANALAVGLRTLNPEYAMYCVIKYRLRPLDAMLVSNNSGIRTVSLCGVGWGIAGSIAAESESMRLFGIYRYGLLKAKHGLLVALGLRRYTGTIEYSSDVAMDDVALAAYFAKPLADVRTQSGTGGVVIGRSAVVDEAAESDAAVRERLLREAMSRPQRLRAVRNLSLVTAGEPVQVQLAAGGAADGRAADAGPDADTWNAGLSVSMDMSAHRVARLQLSRSALEMYATDADRIAQKALAAMGSKASDGGKILGQELTGSGIVNASAADACELLQSQDSGGKHAGHRDSVQPAEPADRGATVAAAVLTEPSSPAAATTAAEVQRSLDAEVRMDNDVVSTLLTPEMRSDGGRERAHSTSLSGTAPASVAVTEGAALGGIAGRGGFGELTVCGRACTVCRRNGRMRYVGHRRDTVIVASMAPTTPTHAHRHQPRPSRPPEHGAHSTQRLSMQLPVSIVIEPSPHVNGASGGPLPVAVRVLPAADGTDGHRTQPSTHSHPRYPDTVVVVSRMEDAAHAAGTRIIMTQESISTNTSTAKAGASASESRSEEEVAGPEAETAFTRPAPRSRSPAAGGDTFADAAGLAAVPSHSGDSAVVHSSHSCETVVVHSSHHSSSSGGSGGSGGHDDSNASTASGRNAVEGAGDGSAAAAATAPAPAAGSRAEMLDGGAQSVHGSMAKARPAPIRAGHSSEEDGHFTQPLHGLHLYSTEGPWSTPVPRHTPVDAGVMSTSRSTSLGVDTAGALDAWRHRKRKPGWLFGQDRGKSSEARMEMSATEHGHPARRAESGGAHSVPDGAGAGLPSSSTLPSDAFPHKASGSDSLSGPISVVVDDKYGGTSAAEPAGGAIIARSGAAEAAARGVEQAGHPAPAADVLPAVPHRRRGSSVSHRGFEKRRERISVATLGMLNTASEGRFVHPSDGYLDLIIARRGKPWSTIGLLCRFVGRECAGLSDERNSQLYTYVKARSVVLTPDPGLEDTNLNVDGEVLPGPGPFRCHLMPSLLTAYGEW